jgi:hypothetical protein
MQRSVLVFLGLAACGGSTAPPSTPATCPSVASSSASAAPSVAPSAPTAVADAAPVTPPRSIFCGGYPTSVNLRLLVIEEGADRGKWRGDAQYSFSRASYAGCVATEKEISCDGAWDPVQQAQSAQTKISLVPIGSTFHASLMLPNQSAKTLSCLFSQDEPIALSATPASGPKGAGSCGGKTCAQNETCIATSMGPGTPPPSGQAQTSISYECAAAAKKTGGGLNCSTPKDHHQSCTALVPAAPHP